MSSPEGQSRADAVARGLCPICGCPNKPWLRVRTVARCLGLSTRTIRERIRAGKLRARQDTPGGRYFVWHESIHEYFGIGESGDDK